MKALETYLQSEMTRLHIPGLSIAVVRDGEPILARGYGFANIERAVPATEHTVYMLASITKSFAAVGIMMLIEEGRLALDDPISHHLAESPAAWQEITVRHLLTHTSGLENWEDLPPHMPVREPLHAETPDDITRFMTQFPLKFPPGEQYDYSNGGYLLLGQVIARVSGKPLDVFLDERIFRPPKMNWTGFGFRDLNCLSTNYIWNGDRFERMYPMEAWGHTGLVSTVLDLATWDAALHSGQLLKPESLERMWTPARLNNGTELGYGLGWGIGSVCGRKAVGHGGGRVGVSTRLLRVLDDKLTVILLMAVWGIDTDAMARQVIEAI
jgi:D-alanyl-D-alanine carboxypeptidase